VRSIDKLEKDLLRSRRISVADMRQIDEFGVGVLIRRVIDKVKARNGVLHVSFDIDFLDPSVAPGVGTTVPGGATYREAHLVMEMLLSGWVDRSMSSTSNPFLDEHLHHQMRLSIGGAAGHCGADAGRHARIEKINVETDGAARRCGLSPCR